MYSRYKFLIGRSAPRVRLSNQVPPVSSLNIPPPIYSPWKYGLDMTLSVATHLSLFWRPVAKLYSGSLTDDVTEITKVKISSCGGYTIGIIVRLAGLLSDAGRGCLDLSGTQATHIHTW